MRMLRTAWVCAAAIGLIGCGAGTSSGGDTTETAALSSSDAALTGVRFDDSFHKRVKRGFEVSPVPVDTTGKSDEEVRQIGYGSYLVNAAADCTGCHSSQAGFLAGGIPFFLDPAGHVVWTRNLTPDPGTGMSLTEDQFVAALRTGQDFHEGSDGMLIVMPWMNYRWMSDSDLKAIYAYLRAIPAAYNFVPPDNKAGMGLPPAIPFGNVYNDGDVVRPLPNEKHDNLNVRRGLAIQPLRMPWIAPWKLREFGRGSYLANAVAMCSECHTNPSRVGQYQTVNTAAYLTGGQVFIDPPPLSPYNHQARSMSADLLGADHGFLNEPGMNYSTFAKVVTTLTHADDDPPTPLAWPMSDENFGKLIPEDLHSIWVYLRNLRPVHGAADKQTQDAVAWCATDADCGTGQTCAANPATGGNECVGQACSSDAECGACDSCEQGACQPKPAGDACYVSGI